MVPKIFTTILMMELDPVTHLHCCLLNVMVKIQPQNKLRVMSIYLTLPLPFVGDRVAHEDDYYYH